jgi:adenylate cyclase
VDSDDWERADLYQPGAPAAAERLELLSYLTSRGATLAQLVDARESGALPGVAGELVLGPPPVNLSVDEMASRSGVPADRVRRVLLAAGLPVAADGTVPEDLEVVLETFNRATALLGEDAVLAFTRVLGAAATNIAEAAVALFYAELGPGTGREGGSELDRARVSEAATRAFAAVPDVLTRLLLTHFRQVVRRGLRGHSWTDPGIQAGGAAPGPDRGEVTALGFVDLVGSTSWAEELSLREQSLALSRFESAAWSSAVLAGGRLIKTIGDEAFFAAQSPEAACRIGVEVCQAAVIDPVLPPARGAVGYGDVIPREGDYFGTLVNLLARLVKVAGPGEVVVTGAVAEFLPTERWSLRALGPQNLRGLDRPVSVFAIQTDVHSVS